MKINNINEIERKINKINKQLEKAVGSIYINFLLTKKYKLLTRLSKLREA